MNRATMRQKTADFCGDADQTRYSGKYNDALDRAQEQFALESRALWKDVTWTTADGTAAYAFSDASADASSNFLYEDWVTYDGKELTPVGRHELNRMVGEDWTDDTGTPTHFIIDPEEAQKKIRLYPIPQEAKTLSMRYFVMPTAMSSDSSTPLNSSALMTQFHYGLCAFAAFDLLMSEQTTPEIERKKKELLAIYNDAKNKAIQTFKNTVSAGWKIQGTRTWR